MGYELEEIKKFIRSELKKGYAIDTIKSTLASSGFTKSQIKKAFATLHKKEKSVAISVKPIFKPKKPKGPGMFSGWFKPTPVVKKVIKKPAPKPAPKKKGPGLFEGFFFKEVKPQEKPTKPVKKILPKPVPKSKKKGPRMFSGWFVKKPTKPKIIIKKVIKKPVQKPKPKPKGPGLFSRLFTQKTTTIKTKKVKIKIKPKPIPKPKKKGLGFFSRLFKPKSSKPIVKKVVTKPVPKPKIIIKRKGPGLFALLFKPIANIFKLIGKILSAILYKLTHPKRPKPIAKKERGKRKSHLSPQFLAFYLVMFFIIIALIIYFFPATCITEECFVEKANNCESATFRNVIGGTTLYYETDECYIVKTVTRMSNDEPKVMQDRFLRKSMTCSYNKGDFDPLYINTISAHLNTCEGELREGILKVLL